MGINSLKNIKKTCVGKPMRGHCSAQGQIGTGCLLRDLTCPAGPCWLGAVLIFWPVVLLILFKIQPLSRLLKSVTEANMIPDKLEVYALKKL